MQLVVTFSLLLTGSSLLAWRKNALVDAERSSAFIKHGGVILLIYGFTGLIGYTPELFFYLQTHPFFGLFKLGIWLLLCTIGFMLAFPLLQEKLFSYNRQLMRQSEQVMQGFTPARLPIGVIGIIVCILIVMAQVWSF